MKNKITLFVACLLYFGSLSSQNNVEQLFNGKDLSNWSFVIEGDKVPAKDVYSVTIGEKLLNATTGETLVKREIHIKGAPLGYMYTNKKYSNYHLHAEWRWKKEASNSGIFLLIEDPKNPFPNGIECQLHAGDAGDFVLLGGSNLKEFVMPADGVRPAFPVVKKANESSENAAGKWNYADIYVHDGVITVYINGVYQNTGTNSVKEGHIGLQSEGKDVLFRNITVAELST